MMMVSLTFYIWSGIISNFICLTLAGLIVWSCTRYFYKQRIAHLKELSGIIDDKPGSEAIIPPGDVD